MAINEEVYKNLGLKGFLGALPERIYKHLGSLGHVGTISDRLFKEGGYLSYITNLLGVVSRYFVTLDPVLNSYYEIAAPITFTGDFEIEVEFSTTLSNAGNVILGNTSSISSAIFINETDNHRIKTRINNVSITGTTTVNDGLLHKVKIARVGTTFKLYVDGILEGTTTVTTDNVLFDLIGRYTVNSNFFDGIMANAKFTDQSGASDVVTTFKLDNSPAAANYIYGTELLDNNTFTNGTTDWYSPRGSSSLSIINNKLVSIADSTNTFGVAQQIDNLIVGNAYKVKATVSLSQVNSSIAFRVATTSDMNGQILDLISTGTANIDNTFISTATTMYVGAIVGSPQPIIGDTITIDAGITVKEITNYTEANAASEIEYSQENVFGAEEVTNGDFATTDTSYWTTVNASVTIAGDGLAAIDYSGSYTGILVNQAAFQGGSSYSVSIVVDSVNSGSFDLYLYGFVETINSSGVYTYIVNGTSSGKIQLAGSNFTGILSSISVKEITNAVEYKNIPQSARDLYTLDGNIWTDAAGNTIEVAP